ncbi:Uncharacterised protein [Porphyromonas crevioricanis]|uniref:Uncharacterized protein n=1 Tax=Porphyromonas crevioricanis TaxID=393921 RepID=A0A2X4SVW0_9PORP|nr:Uncharacterised protein [Porphyromonas crevioricanis]
MSQKELQILGEKEKSLKLIEEFLRGSVSISLGRLDVAVSQHSADRFDGNTSLQSNQGRKSMATNVCRKRNRYTCSKLQSFELDEISRIGNGSKERGSFVRLIMLYQVYGFRQEPHTAKDIGLLSAEFQP